MKLPLPSAMLSPHWTMFSSHVAPKQTRLVDGQMTMRNGLCFGEFSCSGSGDRHLMAENRAVHFQLVTPPSCAP